MVNQLKTSVECPNNEIAHIKNTESGLQDQIEELDHSVNINEKLKRKYMKHR